MYQSERSAVETETTTRERNYVTQNSRKDFPLINRTESRGKRVEKLHYVRVPSDGNRNLFQNYPHIRPRSGYFQTGQLYWYGKLFSCGVHPDESSVVLECELLVLNENLESVWTGLGRLVRTRSQDDVERSVDEILH
jgi:hypothetical protein